MPPAWKLTSCSTQPLAAVRPMRDDIVEVRARLRVPALDHAADQLDRPGGGAGQDPLGHRIPRSWIDRATEPLEGRLSRGAQHVPDLLPRVPRAAGLFDRR